MTMSELLPTMKSLTERFTSRRARLAVAPPQADPSPGSVPPLRPRVEIPVRDPAPDAHDCATLRERGRHLARQESWDTLCAQMAEADSRRHMTAGLKPVAVLLAEGARTDLVEAARNAVARNETGAARAVLNALEANIEDVPHSAAFAYVVASAHLDVAQAWRGSAGLRGLAPRRREAYERHMQAATDLADCHDPFETNSALWAMVRCAVLAADARPAQRMADDYEDLIDLDPTCPGHLLAFGRDLLPRRFGTWEVLDREARRTAARTADIWGSGGYAWVYMGALQTDPGAVRRLDAELFAAGLHDIVARFPDQHMINRLTAFTGMTLIGAPEQSETFKRVRNCFGWIAEDHLRELHPMVWTEAPTPGRPQAPAGTEADLIRRGRIRAVSTLADFYAPALDAGRRLVFTAQGIRMLKGE